jgi:hypothetical protein
MKKIFAILAIIIVMIVAFPVVAGAAVTTGYIDAPRYSNGNHIKYTFINGANVSLYYIYGSGGSYYSYPIATPNFSSSGDTPKGTPVSLLSWSPSAIGTYWSTIYPRIGGNYASWGSQYTVSNMTNEKVKVAYAIILLNGYSLSSQYASYGIDYLRAQYATNVALQNISAMCRNRTDATGYSPTSGNEQTAAFCFDLGQAARRYLYNSTPRPLQVSPASGSMTVEGDYFVSTVTISLPDIQIGTRSQYYRNNYSINTGAFPAGTVFEGYTGELDASGNQTIKIKVPISGNGGKSFNCSATGVYINRTANVNVYKVGANDQYTRQITADESVAIYTNDISTPTADFTITTPAAPDLTVTYLSTDKFTYEAGEIVTVTAAAANIGYSDVSSTIMELDVSGIGTLRKTVHPLVANGGTGTFSFLFTTPTTIDDQTVTLTATIDPDNTVSESDEENNFLTTALGISAVRPDVTITDTTVQNWYAGKEAVVSVTVKNLTEQSAPSVRVRFNIGGMEMDEIIPVAGNGSNLAVFRFTVPQAGEYTVSFDADATSEIAETDESNNSWSGEVTIVDLPPSIVLDPDDTGMEQQCDAFGLKGLPETSHSDYHTWQEVRIENGNYVTKDFWIRLTTSFEISPDSRIAREDMPDVMESGFGLQVHCTTMLTSNYDHPDKLIGPQMVWVRCPESGYGLTADWQNVRDSLETQVGQAGDWAVTWQYAVNPYSQTTCRLHYTPIWFPDGDYTALAQVFYAWSPVGQLYDYITDNVIIEGDMYDRITTVGR